MLIQQTSFIEKQIKETEAQISGIMEKLESPITTITELAVLQALLSLVRLMISPSLKALENWWLLPLWIPLSHNPVNLKQSTL